MIIGEKFNQICCYTKLSEFAKIFSTILIRVLIPFYSRLSVDKFVGSWYIFEPIKAEIVKHCLPSKVTKMGKIILKEDLNRQTLEELLCEHFNDSKLKIISTDTNDNFLAENDNCNSNIQKLTITIERQNEGYWVIKLMFCNALGVRIFPYIVTRSFTVRLT